MSTVDEWARNRAWDVIEGIEEVYRGEWQKVENVDERREYYAHGLTDMAALLLSDEACGAGGRSLYESYYDGEDWDFLGGRDQGAWAQSFRNHLQAALTKITEDKE